MKWDLEKLYKQLMLKSKVIRSKYQSRYAIIMSIKADLVERDELLETYKKLLQNHHERIELEVSDRPLAIHSLIFGSSKMPVTN